jgi:hypothetical protein
MPIAISEVSGSRGRIVPAITLGAVALALALAALWTGGTAPATAAQTVTLQTAFRPYRLGAHTTIEFALEVHGPRTVGSMSPVTDIDLHLPAGLELAASTLGLANCEPARLLAEGLGGCPPNARVGLGSAIAVVPSEAGAIQEEGSLTVLFGAPNDEHQEVLFYAEAEQPVVAQLVFPGQLLQDEAPFSGQLNTEVPLVPTWPGGPDLAITRMAATIGPLGLTYYRNVRGFVVPFRPRGVALPTRCPRDGFPFRVDLTFLDGTRASATHSVPCP